MNRKSYPERVRSALFHAIKKTAANLDACVKVPGKDFSRKRKLDSETFPIGTIKELYRLRWGIETSFRELKYTIGLSCLHGKKTDFLLQEVFARLILYNYASLIARKIPVPQEKQINFSVAILVCKQFLKRKIRPAQIFGILSKHLSPIRPGRQYKRYQNPVSAVAFQYRFS